MIEFIDFFQLIYMNMNTSFCGAICTCRITYVNMQLIYVINQHDHVNMQHNYEFNILYCIQVLTT